ncbi:MAG: nucleotidyltransferase family protein [Thermoleophilaceae bacterium]
MSEPPSATLEVLRAARSLALDGMTAEIAAELEAAGVPSIVLKGPAIAGWLYRDRGVRAYGDADLLVSAASWERAAETLQRLGFVDGLGPLAHPRMESITSHPWARGNQDVDLHCTLWGIGVEPGRAWEVLSARTVPMKVGGQELDVLEPAARAMHVALHAAQHGYDDGKPMRDLEAALEVLPEELWAEAAEVAAQLDALPGFTTGLRLSPAGHALAERLGVGGEASVDALLRVAHVPLAQAFEELAGTPGMRAKLSVVRDELLPTPGFMRWWSPLARRGRLGLAAAYLWRPLYLVLRAGPGLVAWRRARRVAAS